MVGQEIQGLSRQGRAPKPALAEELSRRLKGPQRYRLLQGYPMPPLMKRCDGLTINNPVLPKLDRKLIVGILPHASCAPSVKGCGYCTFPHETFRKSSVESTVNTVIQEVESSDQAGRAVQALYFGGGTANLTPPGAFKRMLATATKTFDISRAEVTLEGAPAFFLTQNSQILNILEQDIQCDSKRLSMGVQTFDHSLLKKMGRLSLGSPEQVNSAVQVAHSKGMTCSADIMINLPGQSVDDMLADVERASDMGFDQICVYHLVLFRGLGTPWSKQTDMLRALPANEEAFQNWLRVSSRVRELGYIQKTVTNFERSGNYRYENDSYRPHAFDALGFGPAGISCFTDLETQMATKWINKTSNSEYRESFATSGSAKERVFVYGQKDLKILFLTRSLAGLSSSRSDYREHYGSDPTRDFPEEFECLEEAGLVQITEDAIRLTPRGNFFADSVTGLIARGRVAEIRGSLADDPNSSGKIHMG